METSHPLTIVLADDHGIVREGIAALCKSRPEITILGQCSDGEQALRMILRSQPDFAIIDLNMPGLNGLEVVRGVRLAKCPTRLIVLSVSRDEGLIKELFRSGADGYVLKDEPAHRLFDAINVISGGGEYLTQLPGRENADNNASGQETTRDADPISMLSKRELEVFSLLVEGMRPKDIAKLLDISPKTVDTYRANIMRKLEVDGIPGLVRFALQRNITSSTAS